MASQDPKPLLHLLTSTLTLLSTFTASLTPSSLSPSLPPSSTTLPPLSLLSTSSTLLKAHTTKLSLLAITSPFTQSAISTILRELSTTSLPAILTSTQLCLSSPLHPPFFLTELRSRVQRLFRELTTLLRDLQSLALLNGGPPPSSSSQQRTSLAATGLVWDSCDALVTLAKDGPGGLAVAKAEQWRETIKDAIEELREWKDGTDKEAEGRDGLLDSEDEGVAGDEGAEFEELFHAANSLPRDRPELREMVERAERGLRRVVIMYTAVVKRRLRGYKEGEEEEGEGGKGEEKGRRLEKVVDGLRRLPHMVDEVVSCFYELDEEGVEETMGRTVEVAKGVVRELERGWMGEEDGFTGWGRKWVEAVEGGD